MYTYLHFNVNYTMSIVDERTRDYPIYSLVIVLVTPVHMIFFS